LLQLLDDVLGGGVATPAARSAAFVDVVGQHHYVSIEFIGRDGIQSGVEQILVDSPGRPYHQQHSAQHQQKKVIVLYGRISTEKGKN
jgi:hypothetical protein